MQKQLSTGFLIISSLMPMDASQQQLALQSPTDDDNIIDASGIPMESGILWLYLLQP